MKNNEMRVDQSVRTEKGSAVVVEVQKQEKEKRGERLAAYQNMLKK